MNKETKIRLLRKVILEFVNTSPKQLKTAFHMLSEIDMTEYHKTWSQYSMATAFSYGNEQYKTEAIEYWLKQVI